MKKLKYIIMPMVCLLVAVVALAGCSSTNASINSNLNSDQNKSQRSVFIEAQKQPEEDEIQINDEVEVVDFDDETKNEENGEENGEEIELELKEEDKDLLKEHNIKIEGPIKVTYPEPIPVPRPIIYDK